MYRLIGRERERDRERGEIASKTSPAIHRVTIGWLSLISIASNVYYKDFKHRLIPKLWSCLGMSWLHKQVVHLELDQPVHISYTYLYMHIRILMPFSFCVSSQVQQVKHSEEDPPDDDLWWMWEGFNLTWREYTYRLLKPRHLCVWSLLFCAIIWLLLFGFVVILYSSMQFISCEIR